MPATWAQRRGIVGGCCHSSPRAQSLDAMAATRDWPLKFTTVSDAPSLVLACVRTAHDDVAQRQATSRNHSPRRRHRRDYQHRLFPADAISTVKCIVVVAIGIVVVRLNLAIVIVARVTVIVVVIIITIVVSAILIKSPLAARANLLPT